jgi:hypothetical protein
MNATTDRNDDSRSCENLAPLVLKEKRIKRLSKLYERKKRSATSPKWRHHSQPHCACALTVGGQPDAEMKIYATASGLLARFFFPALNVEIMQMLVSGVLEG